MRNKAPKLVGITSTLALTLVLAACGNGTTTETIVEPAATPEVTVTEEATVEETPPALGEGTAENPAVITVRWWGGDARQAMQLEAIAVFEDMNPDIRVNPEPSSMDGYFDALTVQMAGGNEPDVFTLGGAWPLTFGREGGLMDLTTNPAIDLAPYSAAVLADATDGSHVYGVPTGGNATALIVNKDLFAQAGVDLPDDNTWTWDDFVRIAGEISANTPDGVFGAEMRPESMLGSFAAQRDGIGFYTADGELNVTQETLEDWFQLILDLQDNQGMPSPTITSEVLTVGPEETLMGRNLSAMIFAPLNQLGAFASASGADLTAIRIPGETEFEAVGVAVLPSQWWAIGSNTSYPLAAGRFIDFMVNSPEAAAIMGIDRGIPMNEAIASALEADLTPVEAAQFNYMGRIAQYAGFAIGQPPGAEEQAPLSNLTTEAVMFGQMTPAQAAETWINTMQEALAQAR
ncbi:MAG: extracellular solute-binding protein [Promicromonosporaceae bacterium]|nr:extracellular solute-binding protein [Promicromonosporaceae bacterium]